MHIDDFGSISTCATPFTTIILRGAQRPINFDQVRSPFFLYLEIKIRHKILHYYCGFYISIDKFTGEKRFCG
jgi:hypothetical protein